MRIKSEFISAIMYTLTKKERLNINRFWFPMTLIDKYNGCFIKHILKMQESVEK